MPVPYPEEAMPVTAPSYSLLSRGMALLLGLALSPVWLLTAALIALAMGRPVLFTQVRVGLRRQPFTIVKFRTMAQGRVTRLGRVLRAGGLDELPQLLNVLRGEMRFVGPRPLTPADVARLRWDTPFHDRRWSVPPGLTGPAQLSPRCHAKLSWHHDSHYARHRTPGMDAALLLQSAFVPLIGKRALKRLRHLASPRPTRTP
jgi:lipopolysaccharide/colanic/teichoic acid biosynthesis glycosyltransferase